MREFARLLATLLSLYSFLVVIRIVLSWLSPMRRVQGQGGVSGLLQRVVDPYLNFFRGIKFLRRGPLDFTPLAALLVINVVERILQTYAFTGTFSFGYALATIVQSLWWSVLSLVIAIFGIGVIIRLYLSYKPRPNAIHQIASLDSWLRRPIDFIHSKLLGGREISERNLLWITLAATVVLYILLSLLINLLIGVLVKLPF